MAGAERTRPRIAVISPPIEHGGGFATFTDLIQSLGDDMAVDLIHVPSRGVRTGGRDVLGFLLGLVMFAVSSIKGRFDLCHVHLAVRGSLLRKAAFVAIARMVGIPTVLHIHSGRFPRWVRQDASPPWRFLAAWLLNTASALCTVTPALRQDIASMSKREGVHYVPNASIWPSVDRTSPETGRVLFMGRFVHIKGLDVLLSALAEPSLLSLVSTIHIAGGQGDLDPREVLKRTDIPESKVEFHGWLDASAVHAQLAQASVFVLPSRSEGAPLTLLEAMSMGTPTVATAVGDVPRMLRGRGWVVPPEDAPALTQALREALSDPVESERRGKLAREYWLQHHTPNILAGRLQEVYASVLAPGDGGL